MSATSDSKSEARSLLIQAFTDLDIPRKGTASEGASLFKTIYWEETAIGYINLVFSGRHYNAGRIDCSIEVSELAERILEVTPDSIDALTTLLDMCEYFKSIAFTLLPITHQNILTRAQNRRTKRGDKVLSPRPTYK